MKSRICPFCGKEFNSGASYRVHKSRYHRGEIAAEEQDYKYTMDNATTDEPQVVLEDFKRRALEIRKTPRTQTRRLRRNFTQKAYNS